MSRDFLETSLCGLYPTFYSLSLALTPEPLQAEQICLDALDLLMLNKRKLLEQILGNSDKKDQDKEDQDKLRGACLGYIWSLGVKRNAHLRGGFDLDSGFIDTTFYKLGVVDRGIIFLKVFLGLGLKDVQSITGCDRYEILACLSRSREQLLKENTGRSVTSPANSLGL